jgi:hypothetical protein
MAAQPMKLVGSVPGHCTMQCFKRFRLLIFIYAADTLTARRISLCFATVLHLSSLILRFWRSLPNCSLPAATAHKRG